jgi:hypothetical protein
MPSTAASFATGVRPDERLGVLFEELAELAGQRNAIDGRIVEIVAELDHDELCGATGARSVAALVAWKAGTSPSNAETIAAVARRLEEFPRCAAGMRAGRLSLDQVGVIAKGAAEGSDEHYAELAEARLLASYALRSSWNRGPNPVLGRNRRGRSPRSSTTSSSPGRSNFRAARQRSSTPHCGLIATRWSPSGSATALVATAYPSRHPRYRAPLTLS